MFARDGHFEAEVFGTQFLNDCPQELWDGLDSSAIAADLGALAVKLNGPRHWVIDGIGQKVNTQEPVLREFNGLRMRRLALIDLGDHPSTSPYYGQPRAPGRGLLLRLWPTGLRAGVTGRARLCHAGLLRGR